MLASLLFPYDNDAPVLIDGWLAELEREGCVVRYLVDGTSYLEICKWLSHQKIDRPSASKFPGQEDGSRIVASPRECSALDQGPRTEDQGQEGTGIVAAATGDDLPPEFVEAWEVYPKRAGGDSRKDALKSWRARIKSGVEPNEILAGVQRYKAFCKATGKIGTEYVMQGQRFFGNGEHFRSDWIPPAKAAGKIVNDTSQYNYQASDDHTF